MEPSNSRKCQLTYVRWIPPFLHYPLQNIAGFVFLVPYHFTYYVIKSWKSFFDRA